MKNRILLFAFLLFCVFPIQSQTKLTQTRHYIWPLNSGSHRDSVLNGLASIRCVAVGDLNNDGKNEIVVTNPAGKDTFQLVWSSPTVTVNGGNLSPRNVLIGDMDNDGKKEIIFENRGNGIFIYEWDGVAGSYNFGTQSSQQITPINCPGFPLTTGSCYTEKMSLSDIDNDGVQELLVSYKGATTADSKYLIIKATGDWATNDAGFSSFEALYAVSRNDLTTWGLGGGAPFGMMAANFDGTGYKEVLLHAWNFTDVTILRNSGGKWVLCDTTNKKQNLMLTPNDGVSYFGGLVADVDKDGRDEVYLTNSVPVAPDPPGKVFGIYFDSPTTPNEIDSTKNVLKLDFTPLTGTKNLWGSATGDIDGNGKPNIYFTTDQLGAAIVSAEFQGGKKNDPANWKLSSIWVGDTCYRSLTIRDSLGKVDTIAYVIDFMFPSKISVVDLYKTGKQVVVAGYQPWYYGNDTTIAVTKLTWNATKKAYDSVLTNPVNPKRLGFVVLEQGTGTGVEAHLLTMITPDEYTLQQNYPNPFNPATEISFTLPLTKKISLKVYDMLGREVRTLINNGEYAKGTHTATWDGTDNFGKSAASGSYVYTLRTENVEKTMKMMLLK
ncbi:MAG: T9SS type A sorting domain-containing protein [Ignavibacteriales bacterium]|nr:T9SS type A sorting domain-containing protein [Ignavibacteriales bacterium]